MKYPLNGIVVSGISYDDKGLALYKGVDLYTNEVLFLNKIGHASTEKAKYLAIVHALGYCVKWKMGNLMIYTDSHIAISWVEEGKANISDLRKTKETLLVFSLFKKAEEFLAKYKNYVPVKYWNENLWGDNPAKF